MMAMAMGELGPCPRCKDVAVTVVERVAVLDDVPPLHVEDVYCAVCECILRRKPK